MLKRKVKAIEKILISLLLAANSFICVFALDDTSSTTEEPVQQETQQETSETQNEVQEAQQNQEYTYSDDSVSVTVTAPVDALPADAILHADKIDNSEANVLNESDVLDDTIQNSVIYDVYFTLNDEEIEPTQPVQVSMNLKIADIDSNMDTSTVNVKHIKDNNEVNTVADTDDVGGITSDGESLNASFTTDSFSYFVICYGKNNINQPIKPVYAYLCYENGKGGYSEIPNSLGNDNHLTITGSKKTYDQADFTKYNTKENTWVHMETLVATYGKYTQGYTYRTSYVVSSDEKIGQEIKWIYYQTSTGTWYTSNLQDNQRPNDILDPNERFSELDADSKIICIFTKDHLSDSIIQDKVAENGYLFLPKPANIPAGSLVTYKWYRNTTDVQTDTEKFEYVPRTKVTGSSYSIESDNSGTRLYPALDMGVTEAYKKNEKVRYWYKVEVYVDHHLFMTTEPIHNMYYACLQNGSFEYPDTQKLNAGKAGAFIPDGTTNLNWHTTGEDKQLEIVYAPLATSGYNIKDGKVPDGNQCAELNAEAAGTLYQDIMSTPNTQLYWKLSHRGRQGSDTMYLLVAPTKEVENTIITQENVNDLIGEILENREHYASLGYYLQEITDGTSGWGSYTGNYKVPEGSYLTRMFFAAGKTASGNDTVGNFIDVVSFSPLLPEPEKNTGYIEVNKIVTGISETDISNYQVQIDVRKENGPTIIASDVLYFSNAIKLADRKYKVTTTFDSKTFDAGYNEYGTSYVITETVLSNISESYDSAGSTYTVKLNEEQKIKGNYTEAGIEQALLSGSKMSIDLTNSYHPKKVSLTVTNKVFGNMGSKNKDFNYVLKYLDDTKNDHEEKFQLKSDETKTFLIPYGTIVYVEQESESDDGYSSYYIVGETGTSVITSLIFHDENNPLTSDVTVNYFNTRNMTVPTVVKSNSGYLLGVIVFGLIGLLTIVFRVKMK